MGEPIGGIVLAAGESARMRCCKATLPVGSTTFLGRVLEALSGAGLSPLVVVAGKHQQQIEQEVGSASAVRVVVNPDWRRGQITSLQRGLREIGADKPVVVSLVDHPGFSAGLVGELIAAYEPERVAGVIPRFRGKTGHPVLFGPEMTARLLDLPAEQTARDVVEQFKDRIIYLDTDEEAVVRDIDTREEYEDFLSQYKLE